MTNVRFAQLPSIDISWTQAVITVGGVFVRYNVYRRIGGETTWTKIATISTVTVTRYRDFTPSSRVVYEYAVTQEETIGVDTLESAYPTPVAMHVDFNWTYLHWVSNPLYFVPLYSFNVSEEVQQDVEYKAAWGRTRPTAFIGDLDFSRLRVEMLPDKHRGEVWDSLREMLSLQPTTAAVYCLRVGVSGRRFFVNIDASSRRGQQGTYDAGLGMTETYFEEAV